MPVLKLVRDVFRACKGEARTLEARTLERPEGSPGV